MAEEEAAQLEFNLMELERLETRTWILLLDLGRLGTHRGYDELSRTMLTLDEVHLEIQAPHDIPARSFTLGMPQLLCSLKDPHRLPLRDTKGAAHDILAHSRLLLDVPEHSDTTIRQIVLLTLLEDPHLPRHPHTITHSLTC